MIPASPAVKKYAKEDANEVAKIASERLGFELKLDHMTFQVTPNYEDPEDDYNSGLLTEVTVYFTFTDPETGEPAVNRSFLEYLQKGDDIFIDKEPHEVATVAVRRIKNGYRDRIISKTDILAADDDADDPSMDDGFDADPDFDVMDEDASMDDTLDSMADDIEDLQDAVDEVQEDDPSIDIDNNISDHYIVECDRCKGIFISAVIESDQQVRKVTGTCPLCGKETEQLVKWIVRDIDQERF